MILYVLVTYLNTHDIWFAAVAHPEIRIGTSAIVMQVGTRGKCN